MEVSFDQLPRSAREAKALGQRYYFTGKPCVKGHVTKRVADWGKPTGGRCHACLLRAVQESATRHPGPTLIRKTRSGAKRRGIVFTITKAEMLAILEPMVCSRTGRLLSFDKSHGKNPDSPSFDRIDNAEGYVSGNVQLVCWAYNDLKNTLSDAALLTLAREIVRTAGGSLI